MTNDDRRPRSSLPHRISLDSRSKLTISGVEDVESFDESAIVLSTCDGDLIVRGCELHIEKLSLDGGDLLVEGTVDSLSYESSNNRQGGFFARLLRP
ncbi:MAG: forespore shell protein [Firmicutes bacterium]|nr:forespore shell protein [Bacillota bacterium]